MSLIYDTNKKQVTLCTRRTCCPKAELLSNGKVKIIDDDGNSVVMTIEEAKLLSPGIDLLKEKSGRTLLHD